MNAFISYIVYLIGLFFVWRNCGAIYGITCILVYMLYEIVKIRTLLGG